MISLDNLVPVGSVAKTHGVKGEVNVEFSVDVDLDGCTYFIMEMDGIPVPFFIESYRYRNDVTALVSFDGVDTEAEARRFFGKTVYVERDHIEDLSDDDINAFVGYAVLDEKGCMIGRITGVDDSTVNVLFVIDGRLVPVAAVEVIDRDDEKRCMTVALPDGLLDL